MGESKRKRRLRPKEKLYEFGRDVMAAVKPFLKQAGTTVIGMPHVYISRIDDANAELTSKDDAGTIHKFVFSLPLHKFETEEEKGFVEAQLYLVSGMCEAQLGNRFHREHRKRLRYSLYKAKGYFENAIVLGRYLNDDPYSNALRHMCDTIHEMFHYEEKFIKKWRGVSHDVKKMVDVLWFMDNMFSFLEEADIVFLKQSEKVVFKKFISRYPAMVRSFADTLISPEKFIRDCCEASMSELEEIKREYKGKDLSGAWSAYDL